MNTWANYVFDILIPKRKKENPDNKFYQNLEKWVTLISYWRFYPDMWYDMISPKTTDGTQKGGKFSLDQRVALRGMSRFKHFHAVLSRGSGKCVTGDTLIFTDQGIREIGSLFNYQNNDVETIKEQKINILNRYGELETSPRGIYSGYKDTRKITTQLGYSVECTLNHKLMVYNNGNLEWKETANLSLGDYLLISRNNKIYGNCNKIKYANDAHKLGFNFDIKNNSIPQYVLASPKNIILSFLTGLINRHSSNENESIVIENISEKLSNQLQILLLNLGIPCKRDKCSSNYDLYIYYNKELDILQDENYFYLPIQEIIESKNHTYDVYMPKTNSFIGNGIVNHNTFLNQEFAIHSAIFYPDTSIAVSAQTKENSASLIGAKFKEIIALFPILEKEFYPAPRSNVDGKTNVNIKWKSGAEIDNLVNNQTSKGQRRRKLIIEEVAQMNNKLYVDVLEPIPNVPRRTIGDLAITSPVEVQGQIHFFTTSWYRGTSEFERSLKLFENMRNLKGVLILGASYELNLLAERGESRSAILSKQEDNPIFFLLNYASEWVGVSEDALVPIDDLLELRSIKKPEFKRNKKRLEDEYVISVDVARSANSKNDKNAIEILKIIRRRDKTIESIHCVNIISLDSDMSFEELSIEVKKQKHNFDAKAIVVDTNGLGIGLLEHLGKEQFDKDTNESLGAFKPLNEDLTSADDCAEPIVYSLKSSHINRQIIINFQNYIKTKKVHFLEKKEIDYTRISSTEQLSANIAPHIQTDLLMNELANLKLDISDNNTFTLIRLTRKIKKDRYSALAYGLYYIKEYEEVNAKNENFDIEQYFFYKSAKQRKDWR